MKPTLKDIPSNIIESVLDRMQEEPKSLDERCIVLKDGTKINCNTNVFMSDVCPHGVFLCSAKGECKEGCMWMVNGRIAAPPSKREPL